MPTNLIYQLVGFCVAAKSDHIEKGVNWLTKWHIEPILGLAHISHTTWATLLLLAVKN